MNQLIDRLAPWAPLALLLGIVASMVEAAEERDVSSSILLLISLAAALVVLRVKRGLTRPEVRAEVAAGVRGLVRPESLINPPRHYTVPPGSSWSASTLSEAPTDPSIKEDAP